MDVIRLDRVVHDAKLASVRVCDAAGDDSRGRARAQTRQSENALHRQQPRVMPRDLRTIRMRNTVTPLGSPRPLASTAVLAHFRKLELHLRYLLHAVLNDRSFDWFQDKCCKRSVLPRLSLLDNAVRCIGIRASGGERESQT
jgi:hypothetical protein